MNCWKVLSCDKFTVFNPAKVIADTVKKRESVKLTLWKGVEEPQKIMAATRHVIIK